MSQQSSTMQRRPPLMLHIQAPRRSVEDCWISHEAQATKLKYRTINRRYAYVELKAWNYRNTILFRCRKGVSLWEKVRKKHLTEAKKTKTVNLFFQIWVTRISRRSQSQTMTQTFYKTTWHEMHLWLNDTRERNFRRSWEWLTAPLLLFVSLMTVGV